MIAALVTCGHASNCSKSMYYIMAIASGFFALSYRFINRPTLCLPKTFLNSVCSYRVFWKHAQWTQQHFCS